MRQVHAEGTRERNRMRNHTPDKTLSGTTFVHECRICGADHGTERHTRCPECGAQPYDFYNGPWGNTGEHGDAKPERARFPFRTDTSWSSKRVDTRE